MSKPRFPSALAGVVVAVTAIAAAETARANQFDFMSSGSCSEACSANAAITPGAGMLTVVLTDTQANPRSIGDVLSDIEIKLNGTSQGTASLTSQMGSLIDVPKAGPGTTVSGSPTAWTATTSGGQIVLTALSGGITEDMIIGPPGTGYNNTNGSIGNFNPYINQTGTFVISDSVVTSSTTIAGVTFGFGNGPDTSLRGVACNAGSSGCVNDPPPAVPEPGALAVIGSALVGFGIARRRKSV